MISLVFALVVAQPASAPVFIADPKNISRRADVVSTQSDGGGGALRVVLDGGTVAVTNWPSTYTAIGIDGGPVETWIVPDPYNRTEFGRTRVAQPWTLFDMAANQYGRNQEEIAVTYDGGAVADSYATSSFVLSVPGTNGAYARARTNTWWRYQAGRAQRILLTTTQSAAPTNQLRRWGYYDDKNGLFFQVRDGVLSIVRRTSTGELDGGTSVPYEVVMPQAEWTHDPLTTIDWTKGNIWEMEFQWLGVGTARFFVNGKLVHEILNAGFRDWPYIGTANLPLSWEIENTGTADAGSLSVICGNVSSEGGQRPPEYGYAHVNTAGTSVSGTEIPIMSLRLAATHNTIPTRATMLPTFAHVEHAGVAGLGRIYIRLNPTLTNATFATVVNNHSCAEIDTAATAVSGGILLGYFVVKAGEGETLNLETIFHEAGNARHLDRNAFTGVSDVITISASMSSGTSTLIPSIQWTEIK